MLAHERVRAGLQVSCRHVFHVKRLTLVPRPIVLNYIHGGCLRRGFNMFIAKKHIVDSPSPQEMVCLAKFEDLMVVIYGTAAIC